MRAKCRILLSIQHPMHMHVTCTLSNLQVPRSAGSSHFFKTLQWPCLGRLHCAPIWPLIEGLLVHILLNLYCTSIEKTYSTPLDGLSTSTTPQCVQSLKMSGLLVHFMPIWELLPNFLVFEVGLVFEVHTDLGTSSIPYYLEVQVLKKAHFKC